MIQRLGTVIIHRPGSIFHYRAQVRILKRSTRNQTIQIINISLQMLPVMKLYRLPADYRLQGIHLIRQRRKRKTIILCQTGKHHFNCPKQAKHCHP